MTIRRYKFGMFGYFPEIDWQKTVLVCLHNFNVMPHFYIMLYSLVLKIFGRKKFALVVTPHGGFNPEWSIFPLVTRVFKWLYHYTLGTMLINLSVDGVRAVSEWEREQIIGKGVRGKIVKTISNGIEDVAYADIESLANEQIKSYVQSLGRYIIQIGRVYGIKNYETTLRALAKVSDKELKYVIAGPVQDNEYKQSLEALISSLNLDGRVIFLGVIRGVDKFYLIKHAQMMVHMAIWESFCNVVHEGMSQGLVCIVARNTALTFLIKEGVHGYLVDTYDDNRLAEKIDFVLKSQNSPEIQKIRETNREFGREHSWSRVAMRMNDWYLDLTSKCRTR